MADSFSDQGQQSIIDGEGGAAQGSGAGVNGDQAETSNEASVRVPSGYIDQLRYTMLGVEPEQPQAFDAQTQAVGAADSAARRSDAVAMWTAEIQR